MPARFTSPSDKDSAWERGSEFSRIASATALGNSGDASIS